MLKLVRTPTPHPTSSQGAFVPRALEPITRDDGTDPFAALHDLVWLHTTTAASSERGGAPLDVRLYEVWAEGDDDNDDGVRLLLGLAVRGQRASVWDLGLFAESALVTCVAAGHLVIEFASSLDRQRPCAVSMHRRLIDVRYSYDGRLIAPVLRIGSRLVARAAGKAVESLATLERIHDADLECDDFLHARLFERASEPSLLLQLSGPCGETRSFDLGIDLRVSAMEADAANTLRIVGATPGGARTEVRTQLVNGTVKLVSVGECKRSSTRRATVATIG